MEDVQPETHCICSMLRPQCEVELLPHVLRGVKIKLANLLGPMHPLISAGAQESELPARVIQSTLNVAAQTTPDLKTQRQTP